MQYDDFMKQVRLRGGLHDNEQAKNAIRAVFETLKRRIVHDTGDNIKAQLPHDIQPLWESGFMEHVSAKMGGTERLDLLAFISRVGDRMETDDFARVEFITRAVITTLRQAITPGAQESVERELPTDLREFWLSCEPPEMPQEAQAARQHVETKAEPPAETLTGAEPALYGAEIGGQPLETEEFRPAGTKAEELCYCEGDEVGHVHEAEIVAGAEPRPYEAQVGGGAYETEDFPIAEDVAGQQTEFERIYHAEQGVFEMEAPVPTETQKETPAHETVVGHHMEAEVHPPAEERMETIPPPGAHKAEEGPGSETHYRLDPQLEQEVKELLDKSDELEANKINVFVQAGNVTLRGVVRNENQRQTAGRIAARALGVGDILNELAVEEETGREGFLY